MVTAPFSTSSWDSPVEEPSFSISDDVEQMDVSLSTLQDTFSHVGQYHPLPSALPNDSDPKSHLHILSVVLSELEKSELLV